MIFLCGRKIPWITLYPDTFDFLMTLGLRTYIVMVLVALGSFWLSGLFSISQDSLSTPSGSGIDYYVNHFEMTVTDDMGFRKHRLKADSMVHFNAKDTTELEKPIVTLFNSDRPPWVIRSDMGTMSQDGAKIFFGGDVFVDRDGAENVKPVQIVTRNLWMEPERKYAETEERVDIRSLSDNISGVGMRVFFSNPIHLTLLGKVKGKYGVY